MNTKEHCDLLKKAALFTMGKRLNRLYSLCESQKTVSTRKLERLLDEVAEADRLHAIYLTKLADKAKKD